MESRRPARCRQGRGVAGELLNAFNKEISKRGIKEYKVIVGQNLVPANKFYLKNGFQFHSQDAVHKNSPSNVYIYKI